MMRILLSFSVFLFSLFAAHAQNGAASQEDSTQEPADSVVRVIGWFCTGDTLEYKMSTTVAEVVGNDTTIIESDSSRFLVCVTDSTKKGYVMEYRLTDFAMRDTTTLKQQIHLQSVRLGMNTKVLFTTNELGVFQEIKNKKELYNESLLIQKQVVDDLYKRMPSRFGDIAREDLMKSMKDNLDEVFRSDKNLGEQYLGLQLLFTNHGRELILGEREAETDGSKAFISVNKGKIEDEEYSSDDDYQVYMRATDTQEDGSTVKYFYDYSYFSDGWPCEVLTTIEESQGDKTTITQIYISWLSRSWK